MTEAGPAIGFVGLGNMGAPMAARLGGAGHHVRAFDADAAARRRAGEAEGVTPVDAVAEVAAGVVVLMLPSSDVVEQVVVGDGLLGALHDGAVIVDMSSSEPTRTQALAERTRGRGVILVDAPVSGGVTGARDGTLTIMVGGPEGTVAEVTPLLEVLGRRVVRAGDVGAGHAVKALNNLMSATHLLATAEAMEAAAAFGLEPDRVLEIVNGSSGRSGSTERKWPNFVLPGTFDSGFSTDLMVKDMRIALDLAHHAGSPTRLSEQAVAAWTAAAAALPPGADHTEIARWVHDQRDPQPKDTMALSPEQHAIKDDFIEVRGTWGEPWQRILELDPHFLRAYLNLSSVAWRKSHLEPKVKSFMYIAVDAAATHLYVPGIHQHVKAALGHGATPQEIMEVLELASTLGIHACNIGVPLLLEVLEEEGMRTEAAPLDARREALKEEFVANRGYWHEFWDGLLELDPDLFEGYVEFSSVPWRHGVLEPKIKELVYIAFDASATHLYAPGLKLHLRNAVRLGATVEEIMEVFDIVSVIGIHAATVGAPILAEELAAFDPGRA